MIFCDLDGVLADFVSGACEVHGRPLYAVTSWNWYEDWGMTSSQFWEPIKAMGYGFYREFVPPYPWTNDLINLLKSHGEFVIVTANPRHNGLATSKLEWMDKHIGFDVERYMTFGGAASMKARLAGPGRILIDDSDDNIEAFRKAGGDAITLPQPWNRLHNMTSRRIEYVRDCLQTTKGQVA